MAQIAPLSGIHHWGTRLDGAVTVPYWGELCQADHLPQLLKFVHLFENFGRFLRKILLVFKDFDFQSKLPTHATMPGRLCLRTEPPRVCRRPFGLSYAAMADCSSMA
jgi:hypothetical protein